MFTLDYIKKTVSNYFGKQPAVSEVFLIGSYALGKQREESDLDLIVNLDHGSNVTPTFMKWQADMQLLFRCKVDVIAEPTRKCHGKRFSFRQTINRQKMLIYTKVKSNEYPFK